MGQLDTIVGYTKRIETFLVDQFGATGRGLHEKLTSVEWRVNPKTRKKIRHVATVRNKSMHEDGFVLQDLEKFVSTAEEILRELGIPDTSTESSVDRLNTRVPRQRRNAPEAPRMHAFLGPFLGFVGNAVPFSGSAPHVMRMIPAGIFFFLAYLVVNDAFMVFGLGRQLTPERISQVCLSTGTCRSGTFSLAEGGFPAPAASRTRVLTISGDRKAWNVEKFLAALTDKERASLRPLQIVQFAPLTNRRESFGPPSAQLSQHPIETSGSRTAHPSSTSKSRQELGTPTPAPASDSGSEGDLRSDSPVGEQG